MDLLRVVYALASVGGMGLLLGLGLAVAGRLLAVKRDERIVAIEAALPGLNCGACGYAGCSSYAEALAAGGVELTLCSPGGENAAHALAGILGVEVSGLREKMVAQVHCRGGRGAAKYEFEYSGIRDCMALHALVGGNKVCKYGCLGMGSCIRVCPADAIDYDGDGLVWVDREKCISCKKCLAVCPTGVMKMIPHSASHLVACNSHDRGPVTRKACSVGCIGCKMCTKQSPGGGFVVEENLSHIDYAATGERDAAEAKCPAKCILRIGVRAEAKESVPQGV